MLLVLALACGAVTAPPAGADGDPASDYLLAENLFLPYGAKVSSGDTAQLTGLLRDAAKTGFPIRVAIVAKPYDLGAVPTLFGQPQRYALFLGQELSFVYKARLLVVMPNGYGVSVKGKPAPKLRRVLDTLPPPGGDPTAMTRGSVTAVRRLAASEGHTLAVTAQPSSSRTFTDRVKIVVILAGIAVLAVAAAFLRRRLRARRAA